MKLTQFHQACGDYGADEWLQIHLNDGRSGLLVDGEVTPPDDTGSVTLKIDDQQVSVPIDHVVHVESHEEWENREARPLLSTLFQYTFGGRAGFSGKGPEGLFSEAAKALFYEQYAKAKRCLLGALALNLLVSDGLLTAEVAATFTAPYQVLIDGRKATVSFQHKSGALVTTVIHF
jgi:hypothetical protein